MDTNDYKSRIKISRNKKVTQVVMWAGLASVVFSMVSMHEGGTLGYMNMLVAFMVGANFGMAIEQRGKSVLFFKPKKYIDPDVAKEEIRKLNKYLCDREVDEFYVKNLHNDNSGMLWRTSSWYICSNSDEDKRLHKITFNSATDLVEDGWVVD